LYSTPVEATIFRTTEGPAPTSTSVILTNAAGFTGTLDNGDQITIRFSKAMMISSGARIRVVDSDCGVPVGWPGSQSGPPPSCTPQTVADIVCGTNAGCVLRFVGIILTVTMTEDTLTINPSSYTAY